MQFFELNEKLTYSFLVIIHRELQLILLEVAVKAILFIPLYSLTMINQLYDYMMSRLWVVMEGSAP